MLKAVPTQAANQLTALDLKRFLNQCSAAELADMAIQCDQTTFHAAFLQRDSKQAQAQLYFEIY